MSVKSLLMCMMAGSLFLALPARGQEQMQDRAGVQLPDGDAKNLVEDACSACHSLTNITNSQGHTPEEWKTTISMMLNVGAAVPPEKVEMVTNYLIKNFPEKPGPAPAAIPGNVEVSFKEWKLPTPGTRPHDPLAAPDGTIWYTGHMANLLGHIDPKTGDIKEYRTNTPMSGPHGLVMDKQGNIWFTANFKAYIGKFEPATGKFTEYPLDPQGARSAHAALRSKGDAVVHRAGSEHGGPAEHGNGRIESRRLRRRQSRIPTAWSLPRKGVPYFVEFGANKIASIDPETMAIHEYLLPNEAARPRRVAITPDDVLYYTDYGRGYLGQFDTKTGKMTKEWLSPSGPQSRPYGITIVNGIVWYSEAGVKPNTLVRFDPKNEKFQTWMIPAGGGVVRNMMHFADGKLVLTESGENVVALVTVKGGDKMAMGTK